MKKSILLPVLFCLAAGAYAQDQKSATPAGTRSATLTPATTGNSGSSQKIKVEKQQMPDARAISEKQIVENRKAAEQLEQTKKNKSFHPNDGSGIITIDFGIVKQGTEITTFFPANFETLEAQESLATHNMTTGDFIKFMKLTPAKGVSAVHLARGKMIIKDPSLFRGFNVVYNTDKAAVGAVDEVVEVFTHQGNLQLRITGYVAGKDTELSMK